MQALGAVIFAMLFDYVWPVRVHYNTSTIIALPTKMCIPTAIKKQEEKKKDLGVKNQSSLRMSPIISGMVYYYSLLEHDYTWRWREYNKGNLEEISVQIFS